MSDSPTGVLKFLFTDEMRLALARHDQVLRAAIGSHGGWLGERDAGCPRE
ncbi:MAG: hypothetical protein ABW298_00730 [Candidatus Binatia bacterium]